MKKTILIALASLSLLLTSCVTPFGILLPGFEVDIPLAPGFNISIDMGGAFLPVYPGLPSNPNGHYIDSNIVGVWKTASGDRYRSFEFYSNGVCKYNNSSLSIPADVCWYEINTRKKTVTLLLNNKNTVTFTYKVYGTRDRYLRLTSQSGSVIELVRVQ